MPRRRCCCDRDPCDIDSVADEVSLTEADTTVIRAALHPQSPYPLWLQVEVYGSESGSQPRVFVAWGDTDGLYIELTLESPTPTSGTVRLYLRDGTPIGDYFYVDGLVSGEWHLVTLCLDPDWNPNTLKVCVDPATASYPSQCHHFPLSDDFEIGRQAGYGTGSTHTGTASFRNYEFDRLWYCGPSPHVVDCGEPDSEYYDYYYDVPARTACHPCACGPGARPTTAADWKILSGTWPSGAYRTSSDDARIVAWVGESEWQTGTGIPILTYPGDESIFGWSDVLGRNQVYVVLTLSDPINPYTWSVVNVGSYYDEDFDWLYFWFVMTAGVKASTTITYSIYRVTDGGSPSLISGPTVLSATAPTMQYAILGDVSVPWTAPLRKPLFGTGSVAHEVLFGGLFRQCSCGQHPRQARKYTATVAGVAAGSNPIFQFGGVDYFFSYNQLNRTGTLRNYFHLAWGFPGASNPCDYCCHANWQTSPYAAEHWFYALHDDGRTILHGYCTSSDGSAYVQLHFEKTLPGKVDLRSISGQVLPFSDAVYLRPLLPADVPLVDPSSATFTVDAVP